MNYRFDRAAAQADLNHGQSVIVTARWIMIGIALVLSVIAPGGKVGDLRVQISLILLLGIANFYLHAQLLRRRSIPDWVAYVASATDILVISILLLPQGGFDSYRYVLYFPALVALSVAFEPLVTAAYAGTAVLLYAGIAVGTAPSLRADLPVIASRVLMLAAVAVCGAVYWHIERDRRLAGSPDSESPAHQG